MRDFKERKSYIGEDYLFSYDHLASFVMISNTFPASMCHNI